MKRRLVTALMLCVAAAPAWGQGVAFFQDGVTPLPGGGFYDGTIDAEFRAANPTEPQGASPNLSIDQFDGGFQTQGAIRFENLLISEGGLVPDGLRPEQILFAEFRLWKTSPSAGDANIDFSRVLGPDTTSGAVWTLEDTWASLGGDLIPDENGLLSGDPIARDDVEATSTPAFKDSPARFGATETVVLNPSAGPVLANQVYTTDADSEDVFDEAWDGTEGDLARAIDVAFWRFDVTASFRDWLADADPNTPGTQPAVPNYGWAITNDTGDGWDMFSSDIEGETGGQTGGFVIDLANLRPALTIIFDDGSAGPLDIDKSGVIDTADFQELLNRMGAELDGPLPTGFGGDFDFDRDVDLNDFKHFKANFPGGPAALAAALANVPEPSAALLLVAAATLQAARRRRS